MAISASEVIDEVLFKMRQKIASPGALARTDVLREINNMLIDLTENTDVFIKQADDVITLAYGVRNYDIPTDCYEIVRVYDSDEKKIYPITEVQLEEINRDWLDDMGGPEYYMIGYAAANKITFYKCPDSDADGSTGGMIYKAYQDALTDSTTSYLPGLIANNKQLVVDWCLGKLLTIKSEVQDRELGLSHLNGYYSGRKRWESKHQAPDRIRIVGVRGEAPQSQRGPNLPDYYPAIRIR